MRGLIIEALAELLAAAATIAAALLGLFQS
jgi:hypothetical protein